MGRAVLSPHGASLAATGEYLHVTRMIKYALLLLILLCPPLSAQSFTCKADSLAGYNCATYYSGTVTLTGELTGSVHQTAQIVATIKAGAVTCKVSGSEVEAFEGPGMLAVVHEAAQAVGGGYSILVWCPEEAGDKPHRGTDAQITIEGQRAASYATLEGKDAHEHPSADAANGISGTETITWSLKRP